MNLLDYKDLIDNKPTHIATVNRDNKPNLAVASNIRVLDKNKLVISINEMNNTHKNIEYNDNVVLTVFNDKWVGLRMFGNGKFYESGEYYDFCFKTFFPNGKVSPCGATKPKGALVITINEIEEYK